MALIEHTASAGGAGPISESLRAGRLLMIAGFAESLIGFRGALIAALQARGLEVHVAAPGLASDSAVRLQLQAQGVVVHEIPLQRTGQNPLADLRSLGALWALMRHVQPDYVLGYTIKPVIYGSLAARLARVPRRFAMVEGLGFFFTSSDRPLSLQRRILKNLIVGLYRVGLAAAHRVVFLNPDDRDEFVLAGLLPLQKAFLLGGIGVDLDRWPMKPPVADPIMFLLAARLLREKGIVQYAEAARIVRRQYPQARFVLLGSLDENPGSLTRSEIQAWQDEGVLEWHGYVPVAPWMEQASVFVLPSYREGVPVSTQEAMAMGRPVITTNVPGCRETVVEGVNGFLVPPRDPQTLADRMMRFLEQPGLIESMGRESRRLAEERFDVHKVNQRLIGLMLGARGAA